MKRMAHWATVGVLVAVFGGSVAAAGAARGAAADEPAPTVAPPSDPNALVMIADDCGNIRTDSNGNPLTVRLGDLGARPPVAAPGAVQSGVQPNMNNPMPINPDQAIGPVPSQTTIGQTQDDDGTWWPTVSVELLPSDVRVPQPPVAGPVN